MCQYHIQLQSFCHIDTDVHTGCLYLPHWGRCDTEPASCPPGAHRGSSAPCWWGLVDSPLGTRLVRSCRPLPEPGASAGNSAGRSRTCQTPLIQRLTWSQQHEEVEKDEERGGVVWVQIQVLGSGRRHLLLLVLLQILVRTNNCTNDRLHSITQSFILLFRN